MLILNCPNREVKTAQSCRKSDRSFAVVRLLASGPVSLHAQPDACTFVTAIATSLRGRVLDFQPLPQNVISSDTRSALSRSVHSGCRFNTAEIHFSHPVI